MGEPDAFHQWHNAMQTILSSRESLADWQDRRFAFAHQVGGLLSGRFGFGEPIDTYVLYGVYVADVGVVYVGQTGHAPRRLYDLAIGESHHLAATVPPELWERVVVVEWRGLPAEISSTERALIKEMGAEIASLALELLFQNELAPPINSRRRAADGTWRARQNGGTSSSRGAQAARLIPGLFEAALEAWQTTAQAATPVDEPLVVTRNGRAVLPQRLIRPA